jgi:two-component system LytT family response regulator
MIKCLVIDDEPVARTGLLEHIRQIDFLYAVGECKTALEANSVLQKTKIDLLFMDIEMPVINGIDFLKTNPFLPPVIFTTAYSEYAIEGFELDVLDYLLKPISFKRFYKAALKAQEYLHAKKQSAATEEDQYFFIKCNQQIEKILISDVIYIEGMSNYIVVHTAQKNYIAYLTFKGIEEQLPAHLFIRIHRSYLIAVNAIKSITTEEVVLPGITLPISKNFKDQVMELVEKRLFKR